jgi:hypothetical protein
MTVREWLEQKVSQQRNIEVSLSCGVGPWKAEAWRHTSWAWEAVVDATGETMEEAIANLMQREVTG